MAISNYFLISRIPRPSALTNHIVSIIEDLRLREIKGNVERKRAISLSLEGKVGPLLLVLVLISTQKPSGGDARRYFNALEPIFAAIIKDIVEKISVLENSSK